MASYTTKFTKNTVYAYLRNEMRKRTRGLEDRPHGYFEIDTGTITLDGASYILADNEEFELLTFPDQLVVKLLDYSIIVNDWDTNVAPEVVVDVMSGSQVFDDGATTAQGGGTISSRSLTASPVDLPAIVTGEVFKLKATTDPLTDATSKTARAKVYVYVVPQTTRTLTGA